MSTLALEIVDAGLVARSEPRPQPTEPSPGYAALDGERLIVGKRAQSRARREPRRTHHRFWDSLDLAPLGRPFPDGMTRADLVHAHLSSIWESQRHAIHSVLLAVPGHVSNEQLGLLLGIARACEMPVSGMVDSAVAAASTLALQGPVIHVDLLLHRAVATELSAGAVLERRRVETAEDAGLIAFHEALAQGVARSFVAQTRFDPLHAAESEQALFDRLPACLDQLKREESFSLMLEAGGREYVVELGRRELLSFVDEIYARIRALVGSLKRAGSPATLLLSPRAAALAQLSERLASLGEVSIETLTIGAAAQGTLASKQAISGSGDELPFVTQLSPTGGTGAEPPVRSTEPAAPAQRSGRAPTHVLFRGVAHAITAEPLVLGSEVGDAQRGLAISGVGPGISKRHCTLWADGDDVVAEDHSSYGSFLNGSRIHGRIAMIVGDRLRLGTPGVELDLIAVAADGS